MHRALRFQNTWEIHYEGLVQVGLGHLQDLGLHAEAHKHSAHRAFDDFHCQSRKAGPDDKSDQCHGNPSIPCDVHRNGSCNDGRKHTTEKSTHQKNTRDEIVVNDGIETIGFDQLPSIASGVAEGLSIDRNLGKSVHVKVTCNRIKDRQDAGHDASQFVVPCQALCNGAQSLNDRDNQTSEANATKAGSHRTFES